MRQEWDEYFMGLAEVAGERATCVRRKVGAVLTKSNRTLATGYNGAAPGHKHCGEIGCLREELKVPSGQRHEICKAVHAEQNIITQCARFGIQTDGSTLYCTNKPCSICAKLIVSAGIVKVVYKDGYPDDLTDLILSTIEVIKL